MILLPLLLAVISQTPAQHPLMGADEVVRQIKADIRSSLNKDPLAKASAESADLAARVDKMSPTEAADGWMALYHDWETAVAAPAGQQTNTSSWTTVMMPPLPPPASWSLIRNDLASGKTDMARAAGAFFDMLLGRDAAVLKYLESLRDPNVDPSQDSGMNRENQISNTEIPLALKTSNVELLQKNYNRKALGNSFFWNDFPDLVQALGKERAAPIVKLMLERAQRPLNTFMGSKTKELARSIVLSDIANLKTPQWALVRGLDDFDFVSAQVAKFGEDKLDGASALVYCYGLAQKGELDHAIKLLSSASPSFDLAVLNRQQKESLFEFLSKVFDKKLNSNFAYLYVALGRELGKADEVEKRLDSWMATPNLDKDSRTNYLNLKADLDCAFGRYTRAISGYEESANIPGGETWSPVSSLIAVAQRVGDYQALTFAKEKVKTMGTEGSRLGFLSSYLAMGDLAEAQRVAIGSLQDLQNVNLQVAGQGRLLDPYPDTGTELAAIYYLDNQPDQVIALLNQFPKWGADDLVKIISNKQYGYYYEMPTTETLGYYAAWALAKTGQKQLAIKILHCLIPYARADAAAYALLNELEGAAAMPLYEAMVAALPLEQTPLLYKGELLFRMGNLSVAEQCVRAAIALNPVGFNSYRLHNLPTPYEILSNILEAKGNKAEAQTCNQIVKATTIAREAEDDTRPGFYSKAADLYKEALAIYSQDGLTHMEYAETLLSLGKEEEALDQYRQSIELVMTSEGAVEGVDYVDSYDFAGDYDSSMALASFEKLKQSHPDQPGLLSVIGEIQSRREDYAAALASYESAVKADPKYLRAWKGILEIATKAHATSRQIDQATVAVIELAPLDSLTADALPDYAAVYEAYKLSGQKLLPLEVGSLYPLPASKRGLDSGIHPADAINVSPVHNGPGAAIGAITSLPYFPLGN
ncbi:MAG TPA: hypothetical protein VGL56_14670 [Fimbriimonadaceae bacterium]|jgi:tetratricopeptide (TPR) repeat protein